MYLYQGCCDQTTISYTLKNHEHDGIQTMTDVATTQRVFECLNNAIARCQEVQSCIKHDHEQQQSLHETIKELRSIINDHEQQVNELKCSLETVQAKLSASESEVRRLEEERDAFSKVSQIIAMERENCRLKRDIQHLQQQLLGQRQDVAKTMICQEEIKTEQTYTLMKQCHKQDTALLPPPPSSHVIIPQDDICDNKDIKMTQQSECVQEDQEQTQQQEVIHAVDINVHDERATVDDHENKTDNTGSSDVVSLYIKKVKGTSYLVSHCDGTMYQVTDDNTKGDKVGVLKKTADGKTKVIWL